ncbi:hypothetical protein DACRYDRAFT_18684 [Dacryopinax primogenitus]|uniref:Uncharacterized protein n=1 Tax=Dacryopinax primogenitus (strain DJM 731) TaxID=1858805 RepID=M5FR09_DACPD|nr:uncharacterized protein DACRYDRAFT_18684 [Dacryopinax primogenitus]EJT97264.1 hypothetical protein DACRYDRAFT_18684 [Dacryopinax primogenitus]
MPNRHVNPMLVKLVHSQAIHLGITEKTLSYHPILSWTEIASIGTCHSMPGQTLRSTTQSGTGTKITGTCAKLSGTGQMESYCSIVFLPPLPKMTLRWGRICLGQFELTHMQEHDLWEPGMTEAKLQSVWCLCYKQEQQNRSTKNHKHEDFYFQHNDEDDNFEVLIIQGHLWDEELQQIMYALQWKDEELEEVVVDLLDGAQGYPHPWSDQEGEEATSIFQFLWRKPHSTLIDTACVALYIYWKGVPTLEPMLQQPEFQELLDTLGHPDRIKHLDHEICNICWMRCPAMALIKCSACT